MVFGSVDRIMFAGLVNLEQDVVVVHAVRAARAAHVARVARVAHVARVARVAPVARVDHVGYAGHVNHVRHVDHVNHAAQSVPVQFACALVPPLECSVKQDLVLSPNLSLA